MNELTNKELIEKASSIIRSRKNGNYVVGDVGCALLTSSGNVYFGVCIDTSSSMGFCAKHNAIGSMVTAGESKIKKIVAIWKDQNDVAHILSPCGRCREFIYQVDKENLDVEVILEDNKVVKLKELLPYYGRAGSI